MLSLARQLRRRIALLMVAVMLVVPVYEAFACALESVPDVAAHAADAGHAHPGDVADTAHDDLDEAAHGDCVHNHCHHGAADRPPLWLAGSQAFAPGAPWLQHDRRLPGGALDGVMRPPRG